MVSVDAKDTTVAHYRPKQTCKLFTGSNFIQNSSSDVYFAYLACSSLRIVHIVTIIIAELLTEVCTRPVSSPPRSGGASGMPPA